MSHACHWPGCEKEVPPKLWGCREHWYTLPQFLRDAIWRHYVPGQEVTKTPSREYVGVAKLVQIWIDRCSDVYELCNENQKAALDLAIQTQLARVESKWQGMPD